MRTQVGPHAVQCSCNPGRHVVGMEAVHQEQPRYQFVAQPTRRGPRGIEAARRPPAPREAARGQHRTGWSTSATRSSAALLGHRPRRYHRALSRLSIRSPVSLSSSPGQWVEPRRRRPARAAASLAGYGLGRRVQLLEHLASPRYMCTPHGRHGSKLRTVRMMSMPLKWSRSFSSKIGWPCTASSYGPGVP